MREDVRDVLERASRATSRSDAWAILEPLRAQMNDRDVAETWVTLLAASPSRAGAMSDTLAALDAHPSDEDVVDAALGALLAMADLVPFDEPRREGDAAYVAVTQARSALTRFPRSARMHAALGNALARLGPASDVEAVQELEEAIRIEARGEWLSDLGVVHKRAHRFRAALTAFEKARGKLGDARPLVFHVALCAIATSEHSAARDALTKLGLRVEGSERPFVPDMPEVRVRLATLGSGQLTHTAVPDEAAGFEHVWMQPLSPVHGVVRTPTHREAIADFGDVVLVDPAPVAFVNVDGKRQPVLGVLDMLARGDERRFRFLALEQRAGDAARIGASLPEGCTFYLHGTRVEQVCPRCAAGEMPIKHEHLPAEEHRGAFGKLVVAKEVELTAVRDAIERARAAHPGVLLAIPALYEAIGDTPAAGKAHKTWGAIERGLAAQRQ